MKTPWAWLRARRRRASEWQDELDHHLAMRAAWNHAEGLPPEDARRSAVRQFGNRLHTLEEVRAVHVRTWLDDLRQDARLAVRGLCSLAVTRLAKGLLFGVAPGDPVSLIAAAAVLALTAVLAAWIPSRRAARVDPMVALRYE